MKIKACFLAAFAVAILALSSCKPDIGTPPLDRKEMVALMIDVHLAQATVSRQMTIPPNELYKHRYFKSVLDKHNISEAKFDSAVGWYARNATEYKKVYADVVDSLMKRRSKF